MILNSHSLLWLDLFNPKTRKKRAEETGMRVQNDANEFWLAYRSQFLSTIHEANGSLLPYISWQ